MKTDHITGNGKGGAAQVHLGGPKADPPGAELRLQYIRSQIIELKQQEALLAKYKTAVLVDPNVVKFLAAIFESQEKLAGSMALILNEFLAAGRVPRELKFGKPSNQRR